MKKLILIIVVLFLSFQDINAQIEYKIITSVESIVPSGLGRSRIISSVEERDRGPEEESLSPTKDPP